MIIYKTIYKLRSFSKKFQRNEDGIAAIEFAIIAVPFMMLLFGIIELALVFFVGSTLQAATFEASRLIRTGQFTAGDENQFKTEICKNMRSNDTAVQAKCKTDLTVTVLQLSDFSEGTSYGTNKASVPLDADGNPINYTSTAGGDTVIITAVYKHTLNMPGKITRLANVEGENARNIVTVTAFRNEPF